MCVNIPWGFPRKILAAGQQAANIRKFYLLFLGFSLVAKYTKPPKYISNIATIVKIASPLITHLPPHWIFFLFPQGTEPLPCQQANC